jgi:hypothetical protein
MRDVPHDLDAGHNTIIERFHRAFPTIEDAAASRTC